VVRLRPEDRANLQRLLDHTRTQIKRQRRSGRVDPNLIGELGPIYQDLENRGEYVEALKVVEVAFQGLRYVKHPRARQELSYRFWRAKGVTNLWLGRHGDSIEAYEKAIEFGEKGAYANEKPRMPATNRRELGSMYWRVGDHSEALRNLSIAEGNLERDRAAIHEPKYLDELARIRAAFSLVYLDLGRYTDAAENVAEAARIHEELGAQYPLRYVQAAIAYTTLGNARREAAQKLEADLRPAFAAFDDAQRVLEKCPSKDEEYTDRESDIYLGRGRALLLEAEYETALQRLERSLSLASDKNIAQHAAAHYLYVGESPLMLAKLQAILAEEP
jgi:tetratricopeptide (TPR) repeat protein